MQASGPLVCDVYFLDVTMAGSTTRRVLLLVTIMRCIRADVPMWPASGVCVAKCGAVAQPERENIGIDCNTTCSVV